MTDSIAATGSTPPPAIHWLEDGVACTARWRSERGVAAPQKVVLADDRTTADAAYRLACEGTGLLWRGDFQNARQLLQALTRRADKSAAKPRKSTPDDPAGRAFHLHRQARAQRARVLGMLLLPFGADHQIKLRRAPDTREACAQAWGAADSDDVACVASLRDLLGMTSAFEWRKKGVEIKSLGPAPTNRVHPHYGVFSPLRGEYVDLVANTALPPTLGQPLLAFDIGTGSGVLAAVLARRGVAQGVATDPDPRALACARENLAQLGLAAQVEVVQADLFPPGQANLVVCNPPWLPARASAPIERAVYDEDSRMLLGFLAGLAGHLLPGGEGWLILSDLAEHLGLRTRAELLAAFDQHGLTVLGRLETQAQHPKAADVNDPLHAARAAERTSLWRLGNRVDSKA
jgi:SAM-dependent methyltransferase